MGLSLHYSGQLRTKEVLPELIEEVKDVCQAQQFPYDIYEMDFPEHCFGKPTHNNQLYGICFTPPRCETVSLTFLSTGKLISNITWILHLQGQAKETSLLNEWVSVKTQFAGPVLHKLLVHLLDHLSKKYFHTFQVSDEGQYWETRNELLLDENFNRLGSLISGFASALEQNPRLPGELFHDYFQRLLAQFKSGDETTQQ
jgi:hypothetical protein